MPLKSVVDKWGFSCLGYEIDSNSNVTKVWCKICREFYESSSSSFSNKKGVAKKCADSFIKGTATVKKNNISDHIKKSQTHNTAVLRLAEKRKQEQICTRNVDSTSNELSSTQASSSQHEPTGTPRQTTILPYIRRLNQLQTQQLTRKFQIAHHVAVSAKSFASYETTVKFDKNVLGVDLGSAYTNRKAGAEMIEYLSKSSRIQQITDPLNSGAVSYYSVLNDGSSSAKTMDEKELFVMRTAHEGTPKFSIMSLEQIQEANSAGLKKALDDSFKKLELNINRCEKEIGMCTDGAPVNVAMHKLVKQDIGDHHMLILCPNHKIELAIHDAFSVSSFNTASEKNLCDIYLNVPIYDGVCSKDKLYFW